MLVDEVKPVRKEDKFMSEWLRNVVVHDVTFGGVFELSSPETSTSGRFEWYLTDPALLCSAWVKEEENKSKGHQVKSQVGSGRGRGQVEVDLKTPYE